MLCDTLIYVDRPLGSTLFFTKHVSVNKHMNKTRAASIVRFLWTQLLSHGKALALLRKQLFSYYKQMAL